jgi:hypothetical protein
MQSQAMLVAVQPVFQQLQWNRLDGALTGGGDHAETQVVLVRLARENVPMCGIGNVTFLRSLDVARAAARRMGQLFVESGALADVDDVMYLTAEELVHPLRADVIETIAARRAEREYFQTLDLPTVFKGMPTPIEPTSLEKTGACSLVHARPGAVNAFGHARRPPVRRFGPAWTHR